MKTLLYNRLGSYAYVSGNNIPMSVSDVVRVVEQNSKIPRSVFCSKSRLREYVLWRQIGMYYSRRKTHATLREVGLAFGGRNHASVLHGIEQIENGIETNDPQIVYKLQTMPGFENIKLSKKPYNY